MNSGGCFNQINVVRPTILCSLIFSGLKMLRDAYFSLSSKPIIAFLKVLMPLVVDSSISWKYKLVLKVFIFVLVFVFVLKYKCKGSVASLQFGFSNLFKSPPLQSWMLGFRFNKLIVLIVAQNGNAKVS